MTVHRGVLRNIDFFNRAQAYTTTPGQNGWTSKKTGSGTPTHLNTAGGAAVTLSNTSEAQVAKLYQNDVLVYPLAALQLVDIVAQVADISAVTTLALGLASGENDTLDSVVTNAWFRMEGSASTSAIVVETDDGVRDLDDKPTGQTLGAVLKRLVIDFERGLSDVRFYVDGQRVAAATQFDMSAAAAASVQPLIQLQKASGTTTPGVVVRKFGVTYRHAHGV